MRGLIVVQADLNATSASAFARAGSTASRPSTPASASRPVTCSAACLTGRGRRSAGGRTASSRLGETWSSAAAGRAPSFETVDERADQCTRRRRARDRRSARRPARRRRPRRRAEPAAPRAAWAAATVRPRDVRHDDASRRCRAPRWSPSLRRVPPAGSCRHDRPGAPPSPLSHVTTSPRSPASRQRLLGGARGDARRRAGTTRRGPLPTRSVTARALKDGAGPAAGDCSSTIPLGRVAGHAKTICQSSFSAAQQRLGRAQGQAPSRRARPPARGPWKVQLWSAPGRGSRSLEPLGAPARGELAGARADDGLL